MKVEEILKNHSTYRVEKKQQQTLIRKGKCSKYKINALVDVLFTTFHSTRTKLANSKLFEIPGTQISGERFLVKNAA